MKSFCRKKGTGHAWEMQVLRWLVGPLAVAFTIGCLFFLTVGTSGCQPAGQQRTSPAVTDPAGGEIVIPKPPPTSGLPPADSGSPTPDPSDGETVPEGDGDATGGEEGTPPDETDEEEVPTDEEAPPEGDEDEDEDQPPTQPPSADIGTLVAEAEQLTPPPPPSDEPIDDIKLCFQTEESDQAGTEGNISITFCKDIESGCRNYELHPTEGSWLDGAYQCVQLTRDGEIVAKSMGGGVKTETDVRYFTVSNGASDSWLVAGLTLEVHLTETDEWKPTYVNPCLTMWLSAETLFDAWDLGPDDTAVCMNIKTGEEAGSGTTDDVWIVFDKPGEIKSTTLEQIENQSYNHPRWAFKEQDETFELSLEWSGLGYDDFEKDNYTSYFATLYDSYPISHRYKIKKAKNDLDKWHLDSLSVWVFSPGSPSFLEHNKCLYDAVTPDVWLSDPVLTYPTDGSYRSMPQGLEGKCAVLKTIRFEESQFFVPRR